MATLPSKSKNVPFFTDSILELGGKIVHPKPFPESKAKQMDHHNTPILSYQYDAVSMRVGINYLLKSHRNSNANKITKHIINIATFTLSKFRVSVL